MIDKNVTIRLCYGSSYDIYIWRRLLIVDEMWWVCTWYDEFDSGTCIDVWMRQYVSKD